MLLNLYDFQVMMEGDQKELHVGGAILSMFFIISLSPSITQETCGGSCTPSSLLPHHPSLPEQAFVTTDIVLQLQATDNHLVNRYRSAFH